MFVMVIIKMHYKNLKNKQITKFIKYSITKHLAQWVAIAKNLLKRFVLNA